MCKVEGTRKSAMGMIDEGSVRTRQSDHPNYDVSMLPRVKDPIHKIIDYPDSFTLQGEFFMGRYFRKFCYLLTQEPKKCLHYVTIIVFELLLSFLPQIKNFMGMVMLITAGSI